MSKERDINFKGALLDKHSLEEYIRKFSMRYSFVKNSNIKTFPIKNLRNNYRYILNVYKLLNNHIKLGIKIHSAGEWLLDNFYIIEENVKFIEKELTSKKYKKLVGIKKGKYSGFPRIYLLAEEIVTYTDCRITQDNIENILKVYSEEDSLSLSEIEVFEIFLKISLIRKIKDVCERIYVSQIQKYKVENLVERIIENKKEKDRVFNKNIFSKNIENGKNSYIEYLSYRLKAYGKETIKFQEILEKEIDKIGESLSEIIRKEHINVASQKVSIGNAIISMKGIGRISFSEIYGKLNVQEKNLNLDPAQVYPKMDNLTKEMYRKEVENISRKYRLSEKFITENILKLCENNVKNTGDINSKKSHVGYYIISKGKYELFDVLGIKYKEKLSVEQKAKLYISLNIVLSIIVSYILSFIITRNIILILFLMAILFVPISEIILRFINYILTKFKRPQIVPKMDYEEHIPEESKTFVVIPSILKSKDKIDELLRKLEVYYLANKLDNIFFAILGDASEEDTKVIEKDKEIINYGIKKVKELNEKYKQGMFNKFHFLYRERKWNSGEEKYIGWERKRGLLYKFNLYIKNKIKDDFIVNTIEKQKENMPDIKYVITLDSDTCLSLDTASKMIGAMDHILNVPVLEDNNVVDGFGIMQPRIGLDLDSFSKSFFIKTYARQGGIDFYSAAISDIYQDYFEEGIFTGKGIYNVDVYLKVLEDEIPENTVLSHDLLEGNFLRTLSLTDVMLLDGYPSKYLSYILRNHRWVRGDIQIFKWLFSNRLNRISKFKIFDNIRRALIKPIALLLILLSVFIKGNVSLLFLVISIFSIIVSFLLELVNNIIFKESIQEGSFYAYKKFSKELTNTKNTILRLVLEIMFLPFEAYKNLDAIVRSIIRMRKKRKLLEWTTSEETDKIDNSLGFYTKEMNINISLGLVFLLLDNILFKILGIFWILGPFIAYFISREINYKDDYKLEIKNEKYLNNIAEKTWNFFKDNINEKNNYLITDNYQEDRKEKIVNRTSSTNIGLELIAVISAYDMGFIKFKETISYIKNILNTIIKLEKWNGHLYNWYNTLTLKPLLPKYVSTVDSGNFIGYLYIVRTFLEEFKHKEEITNLINIVNEIINNTNFKVLYNEKNRLFSIGFNVEQNKLTDSYYDLLASEARQASLVSIAKKDIKPKHWNNLSRTLTNLKEYKGLISWSGTAFEYLMPNINFKRYKGSLLDESSIFLIESQKQYAKILNIPWGISESAYNLKDLNNNYQYKAFGIPWLGLKRGLEEELVISPYSTFLSLEYEKENAIDNLRSIEELGGVGKYGFYESIDFTVNRLPIGKKYMVVKCFMAHHQALIFLSINNFLNNFILRERFNKNPEIEAVNVLLEENMPKNVVITKESKEKILKKELKVDSGYIEYEVNNNYLEYNFISNLNYSSLINNLGESKSEYKGKLINNYKETSPLKYGIGIAIKNLNNKRIIDVYKDSKVKFYPDKSIFVKEDGAIKYKTIIFLDPNRNIEIRKIKIENNGNKDENLEIISYFEPILSDAKEFYAHPVFNKLFLNISEDNNDLYIEKNSRDLENKVVAGVSLWSDAEILDSSFEIDRQKFFGRKVSEYPYMFEENIMFSNRVECLKDYIIAIKKTIKIPMKDSTSINLIICAGETKEEVKENLEEVKSSEEIKRLYELSKARVEEESKYLNVKSTELERYRKFLSYLYIKKIKDKNYIYDLNDIWKFGISGDNKILMCEIKNPENIYELEDILKLYEYYRAKNIYFDLVIINDEKNVYEKFVKELIENIIQNRHLEYLKYTNSGIFILNKNELEDKEYETLKYLSTVFINLDESNLDMYMKENKRLRLIDKYSKNIKRINENIQNIVDKSDEINDKSLAFYNKYGGFSKDGKEYIWIKEKDKNLPSPMCNLLGNTRFGTIITDNLGGMVWYKNSRLNRITNWENDICFDIPSEMFYLYEKDKNYVWSFNTNIIENENNVIIKYGFGYVEYEFRENNFVTNVDMIVPENSTYKMMRIKMKNMETNERNISIASYIRLVLGEDEIKENNKINVYENENIIYAENTFKADFINKVFLYCDSSFVNFTNSMEEFFGKEKDIRFPRILYRNVDMSEEGIRGIGYKVNLNFKSEEEKEIIVCFGVLENDDIKQIKVDIKNNFDQMKEAVKRKWENIVSIFNVKTPSLKIDYLVNGWLIYQTIQSRLNSKSAYYQSGGADGFRDQLQDAIGIKYYDSNILKEQILKCAMHQFIEGDVLHWWHNQNKKGVRTMFSDDLLWLGYAAYEYIEFEDEIDILFEEIEYLSGENLDNLGVLEKYDTYYSLNQKEILFMHIKRAIDLVISRGLEPFPKIWIGDWNDGFSNIGSKGKGESIWLGFFLYDNLNKFIELYEMSKERLKEYDSLNDFDINKYIDVKNELKKNLNTIGWDGRWFKRAVTDDGIEVGSINSKECKIDGLSQSWSVISDAADNDKKYIAMNEAENYLVDKENEMIKLFTPSFKNIEFNPGYIKAYPEGVRENGGQYTHAAIWFIMAEILLGYNDKAFEHLEMINPITHSESFEKMNKFKLEPYVMYADIYSNPDMLGTGGWNWYTGSSSWYLKVIIEYVLGIKIKKGYMEINPSVPSKWNEYEVSYKYKTSMYNIVIKNKNLRKDGKEELYLDGIKQESNRVKLVNNGKIYKIEFFM